MGNLTSTNGYSGAFAIGDGYTSTLSATAAKQMSMRFIGGYRFFFDAALTSGVTLAPGGGSWPSVSDRWKKEHFHALNNEEVLQKIAALPITNWNYKSQDSSVRHIGPMAQDFYAAFRLDGVGTDTTINTTDIDGVNMAAIQAMVARTKALQQVDDAQQQRIAQLEAENRQATADIAGLQQALATQNNEFARRLAALEAIKPIQLSVSQQAAPLSASLH